MSRAHGADWYELPDPDLSAYRRGIGTLSIEGAVVGHLASAVLEMTFPSRQPWLWFVIVWLDGSREPKLEDYGPCWWTARELDAGWFEHHLPSSVAERRFLGLRYETVTPGPSAVFDFEWLPPKGAALKWVELGLTDDDF